MSAGLEIVSQGIDYDGWRLGIQVAVNGKLAPMFDMHKSKIVEVGDGTEAYERLLVESANSLIASLGPAKQSGVPAPSR